MTPDYPVLTNFQTKLLPCNEQGINRMSSEHKFLEVLSIDFRFTSFESLNYKHIKLGYPEPREVNIDMVCHCTMNWSSIYCMSMKIDHLGKSMSLYGLFVTLLNDFVIYNVWNLYPDCSLTINAMCFHHPFFSY